MADHPYDAPTSRRRNALLPPFVAPRGHGDSGRAPRTADSDARRPISTPTRLFTPPGTMPRYTPPAAEPADPAVVDRLAAGEVPVATDEGRGVGAPVLDDGSEATEDWFEVADEEVADAADERTAVPAEPAVLTPSLFNGLSGIETIGPTADPDSASQPQASESGSDPYAWPDPRAVVAEVLERLAARVRDGDLTLPTDIPATTEEAALAAVLSALLRSGLR